MVSVFTLGLLAIRDLHDRHSGALGREGPDVAVFKGNAVGGILAKAAGSFQEGIRGGFRIGDAVDRDDGLKALGETGHFQFAIGRGAAA